MNKLFKQIEEVIKGKDEINIGEFDTFGPIIDLIFGFETYVYLEEQDALLKILDEAITGEFTEAYTIKLILDFLDSLTHYKLDILINNIGENIKIILEDAKGLSELQKKRYSKII